MKGAGQVERLKRKLMTPVVAAVLLLAASVACFFGVEPHREGGDKLFVVATTTMAADLAAEIGGEYVEVVGLMGCGVDPHRYKAKASDAVKLQQADAVIYNGLNLEGKMGDVLESLEQGDKGVICLAEGVDPQRLIKTEGGACDPHIWYDVELWRQAAEYTAERFAQLDPENADGYMNNFRRYEQELLALDGYIKEKSAQIPESKRVLITAHDAFGYFGRAYGFEVKGLQGVSTSAEAGTADISALADFIAERRLPAVFVESSMSPKTVEALKAAVNARGFSVDTGGVLYSDSLGDEASGTETYVKTFKANIDTIYAGLLREVAAG